MFLHTDRPAEYQHQGCDLRPYVTQADVSDELLFDKVNYDAPMSLNGKIKWKLVQPNVIKVHTMQSNDTNIEKKGKAL